MQQKLKKGDDLSEMSLHELRLEWAKWWGLFPHKHIKRALLEKSLLFKQREQAGRYGLSAKQKLHIRNLVRTYKCNPDCFEDNFVDIKPGTKLLRRWNSTQHIVTVLPQGFEYKGAKFTSLSEVASFITGTPWDGRTFFGLKSNRGGA